MTNASSTVAFSKLIATDAINARAATKDGLDELAASIAAKGLIQPLAVRPADSSDKFEVIDGRRRYQAIAKLVKAKTGGFTKATQIPVLVRNETDAEALETSLMANTVRLPMHPVDQYAVFARLAEQGKSDADIAASFGIAERTVRQHKALGKLSETIRNDWKKGKIDADTAKAFTVQPDQAAQVAAYETLKKRGAYALSAWSVKSELGGTRRVLAANIPAALLERYVAAGGKVVEDLFDDDGGYIENATLLGSVKTQFVADEVTRITAELKTGGSFTSSRTTFRTTSLRRDTCSAWPPSSMGSARRGTCCPTGGAATGITPPRGRSRSPTRATSRHLIPTA